MYNKECGILYDSRTKKELIAYLKLLENQKTETEHHINYIKDMLNKFRCVEFLKINILKP